MSRQRVPNPELASDTARLNLLTNGGFQIWQRGDGPFTAQSAYGPDRWYNNIGASSTMSVQRMVGGPTGAPSNAQITYTHSAPSSLAQFLKTTSTSEYKVLPGRVMSASIWVYPTVANGFRFCVTTDGTGGTNNFSPYATVVNQWQQLTLTLTVPYDATYVMMQCFLTASGTYSVCYAMLVVGSVPADYAPLHPADDLARCLRYYEILYPEFFGYASGAGQAVGYGVPFRAIKPVAPTITKVGTWTVVNSAQPGAGARSGMETNTMYFQAASLAAGVVSSNPASAATYIVAEANP